MVIDHYAELNHKDISTVTDAVIVAATKSMMMAINIACNTAPQC